MRVRRRLVAIGPPRCAPGIGTRACVVASRAHTVSGIRVACPPARAAARRRVHLSLASVRVRRRCIAVRPSACATGIGTCVAGAARVNAVPRIRVARQTAAAAVENRVGRSAVHVGVCACFRFGGRVRIGPGGSIAAAVRSQRRVVAGGCVARAVGQPLRGRFGHRRVPRVAEDEIVEAPNVGASRQAEDPSQDDRSSARAHAHHHPCMLRPAPAVPTDGATDTLPAFGAAK